VRAWWRVHREAAPGAVDADLQSAINALINNSGIGIPVPTARRRGIMRLHLGRTRYFLDYRIVGD